MWLAMSNQQTDNHWTLLSGWRKSYELTLQHMSAVRSYRENLAAAWPPQKSPAAQAYLDRLDVLLEHLQQTYDAAVANHSAFSSATLALSAARRDLEPVANEYFANEGKIASHEQEVAQQRSGGGPGPSVAPKPPVADGRQAELEARARSIMYGLSSELMTARTQIQQPKPYRPDTDRYGGNEKDAGPTYSPRGAIPPVVPFDPGAAGPTTATSSSANRSSSNTTTTPPRVPGLILGGIEPAPLPTTNPPIVGPQPPTPNPPLLIVPTPPVLNPAPPVGTKPPTLQPITSIGRGPVEPPMRSVVGAPPGGMRAMPPGGVIGALPGTGLMQPGAPSRPTQVNPIGGVIGPAGTGAQHPSAGRAATANSPMVAGMGPRGAEGRDGAKEVTRWDPDNPWETARGVAPVVVPPAEQRVDPGPAIGLR
jgi:hypothetical protein